MNLKFFLSLSLTVLLLQSASAQAAVAQSSEWQLGKNKITYIVIHPLHRVEGVSASAKGKGICNDKGCEFLIAAPVKSFDSGNSNRDAHMWQTTKAEEFPMVSVSVKIPNDKTGKQVPQLTVNLAGKSTTVPGEINVVNSGTGAHVTGEFKVTFSSLSMERPSLLSVPVKDDIRILVDSDWQRSESKK